MNEKLVSAIKQVIIDEKGRPIPAAILMNKVKQATGFNSKNIIYDHIDKLTNQKVLKKLASGHLVEGYIVTELEDQVYQGTIAINSNLDGYVKIQENGQFIDKEAYVNNLCLNGAITGDLVEIKFIRDKFTKSKMPHGFVTKVIEHNTKYVVGEFQLIGKDYNVLLDDTRNYTKVKLQDTEGLVNGHKVLIEIKEYKNDIAYGGVIKVIGHKNDVGVDILSIVNSYMIETEFKPESQQQADSAIIDVKDNNDVRKDISDRLIVTIDPSTSKDLDDAIHVSKLANGNYFLSVSIADVSSYVKYETDLWNEAIERATSVYLVDRVIPMLPHSLSNNICSLNPEEPRLTLTCDVEIDSQGNYHNIQVYPSLIKSFKRLSYDEVNDYFKTKQCAWNDELKEMIDNGLVLHKILRTKKEQEGFIDFDIKEPKIIVDDKCFPIEIQIRERGIAQRMVEDFMICANEAVTINADRLDIPFIYRTHDKPELKKLEQFAIEAKKLGFIVSKQELENVDSATIANWLKRNKDNVNLSLISRLLLMCMQKAKYSTDNVGHFGLSSKQYTHFTSPIRRIADTIVHTLYWIYVFKPNLLSEEKKEKLKKELKQLCLKATDKEITAVMCEREVNQLKFCQYMSRQINNVFDGIITGIKNFGIFVELDNTIQVLVKTSDIGKDFWKFNSETNVLMGDHTGKCFSFGQKVQVKITGVNVVSKQINGYIIGYEPDQTGYGQRRNNNRKIDPKKY